MGFIYFVLSIADVMGFFLALVETLVAKTRTWEENRGQSFMYDGVPLLAMLDEYVMLRQEREEEKKRMRVSATCSLNLEPIDPHLCIAQLDLHCVMSTFWNSQVGPTLYYVDVLKLTPGTV
jgi:hypothetical protein